MRHLYDEKHLIYCKQTSLQHLLQNTLNTDYFTCDKLKDIFKICIHGYAISTYECIRKLVRYIVFHL